MMLSLEKIIDANQVLAQMDTVAQFITSSIFVWMWCLAIGAYTFRWLVTLLWESLKIKSQLKAAIKLLAKAPNPTEFAKHFPQVSIRFLELDKLKQPWKDFTQTLIPSDQPHKPIQGTREPGEYFHEGTIIQPSLDNQFYGAIPTQLTGLGILGTFLGLASGIYLARSGLTGDVMEELQLSLGRLLSGVALALWTPIVGVLGSLCFSKLEKSSLKQLRKLIDHFNTLLISKISLLPSEQIAHSQLTQNERQTQTLIDLMEEVKQLRKCKESATEELAQKLIYEFRHALHQGSSGEIKHIASAFKHIHEAITASESSLTQHHKQLTESLMESGQIFHQTMERTGQQCQEMMREVCQSLVRQIHEAGDFTSKLLEEPSRLFLSQAATLHTKTSEALAQWSATMEKNQTHMGDMVETQKLLTTIMDPITKATQGLLTMYRNSQDLIIRSNQSAQQINESISKLERINGQLSHLWDGYCQRFETVDHHLKSVLTQTHTSLETYSERMKDFTSDLDKHMSKGILSLAGAVGDLHQVVGHIPEAFKELR